MKIVDVFVFEVVAQTMMSASVQVESDETGAIYDVESTIDVLENTINGNRDRSRFLWCIMERLPQRGFAENCAMAAKYFQDRDAVK